MSKKENGRLDPSHLIRTCHSLGQSHSTGSPPLQGIHSAGSPEVCLEGQRLVQRCESSEQQDFKVLYI